jgi:sarcosine oxidase, subunit gamma
MVELAALRRGPLDAFAADADAAAALSVASPRTKLVLRCASDAIVAAGKAFGIELPDVCRAASSQGRAALWLGPDEWLLLAPPNDGDAITRQFAAEVTTPHALIDVSHRSAGIVVDGPRAAELINCGCALDLRANAFPVGMCTRTLFEKVAIILWRVNSHTYHVEIERSFAPYVWTMLIEMRGSLP